MVTASVVIFFIVFSFLQRVGGNGVAPINAGTGVGGGPARPGSAEARTAVGALPNQISQTLNEQIESTFFDYIAHHRIEAAKPLIVEGTASTLTVSLDVGFHSRSTFYKAFKRETGMTPKAYRDAAASQKTEGSCG